MRLVEAIASFFKDSERDSGAVAVAALDNFMAASERYEEAFRAISAYVGCANRRHALSNAQHALNKAVERCCPDGVKSDSVDRVYADATVNNAAAAYDTLRADCRDPADFEPYTVEYLAAHTGGMEALSAAFDEVTVAFVALGAAQHLYASVTDLHDAHCDSFVFAAQAYSKAASCALTNALEGELQALKDKVRADLLQARAENPAEKDPLTAKSKASALHAKAADITTACTALEKVARIAEVKAAEVLAKARSAHDQVASLLASPNYDSG